MAEYYLYQSAVDHLDMPELIFNPIEVELPPKARRVYREVEDEMIAEIEGDQVVAFNAGSAIQNVARSRTAGCTPKEAAWSRLHTAKLDALAELRETIVGPILVFYSFKHDLEQLQTRWPDAPVINGETGDIKPIIKAWQAGAAPMVFAQCQAMSHGVDGFQRGGSDVVWFGLTDQPEIYAQANARVYRQGVGSRVRIHQIIARSTVDLAIARRLAAKDAGQKSLLNFIKEYRLDT